MINILIVEDEVMSARRLRKLLEELNINHEVIAEVDTVKRLRSVLTKIEVDLILSDIQLADGICFEAYEKFASLPPIIFCTAFDEYAIKAFKFSGIDYLLKPIVKEELAAALDKFTLSNGRNQSVPTVAEFIMDQSQATYTTKILSKVGHHIHLLPVNEIKMIFSDNKQSFAVMNDNNMYLIEFTLKDVETMLNPTNFFRINRQVIIHINSISRLTTTTSSRLQVHLPGFEHLNLAVSKAKMPSFKQWIKR